MSVRNQYARHYTKVTPFPPSNKLISEAKRAAKKEENTRLSSQAKVKSFRGSGPKEVIGKAALDEMTKRSRITQINKNNGGYERNYNYSVGVDNSSACYVEDSGSRRTSNGCEILKVWENENEEVMKNTYLSADDNRSEEKVSSISDTNETSRVRPKSARPESRWERRNLNQILDNNDSAPNKPIRPKSARPESRMLRLMEARDQNEFSSKDDLPPRPRTSYGRRRSAGAEEDVNIDVIERPKSRIGNYVNENRNRERQSKTKSEKSKRHQMADQVQQDRPTVQQGVDNYQTSPQSDFTTWRSKTVLDLNSGIDDIDLDVDPVLYFMQDDEAPSHSAATSHSLSRDTIDFIGNAGNKRRNKAAIGYHGNYQDKHISTTGKQNRFSGNRVNISPNSIKDRRYQSNMDSHVPYRSGHHFSDTTGSPYSEDVSCIDSKSDTSRYFVSSNRSREIINECRGQLNPDGLTTGRYVQGTTTSGDGRSKIPYRRHPRRLQPITATFTNDT